MPATEDITIAERKFTVPNRYEEGHECTAGEAGALNQTFHENIRNNLAKKIKDLSQEEAQAAVDKYAGEYQFGIRVGGGGGGSRDPVKSEAMRIAVSMVKQAIKNKGLPDDAFTLKQVRERAIIELDRHPEWMDEAKTTISARKDLADKALATIQIPTAAPAAVAAE